MSKRTGCGVPGGRRLVAVTVAAIVVALALPGTASALIPSHITENWDSVTHFYRNVHYPLPSQEVCDAMCNTLRTAYTTELDTAPSQAGATAVEGEATALMAEDGGLSAAGFGAIATPLAVGAGGFALGYAFGDFINKNFLHIGLGAPGSNAPGNSYYQLQKTSVRFQYVTPGQHPFFGAPNVTVTEPGYYLTFQNVANTGTYTTVTPSPGGTATGQHSCAYLLEAAQVEAVVHNFQRVYLYDAQCGNNGTTMVPVYGEFIDMKTFLAHYVDQPIRPYTNQSISGTLGPTTPDFDHTKATLQAKLDTPGFDELKRWLDNKLGGDSDDPTSSTITVPSCDGLGYDSCAQRYRDRNYIGSFDHQTETFNAADLNKGAGDVTQQSPQAGSQLGRSATATIKTNPVGDDMPVVVPSFASAPGEATTDYVQRLSDAHLTGSVTQFPTNYAPDSVAVTSPSPGSRARRDSEVKVITPPEAGSIATGQDDSNCDLETPEGDPGPGDPWEEIPVDPPFVRQPLGGGAPVPVALKRGEITNPTKLTGWGYRKIRAKHGWSAWAIQETRVALQNRPFRDTDGRLVYSGPHYSGQNNADCVRWAVVEPGEWYPGKSPGIVTSYGKILGWTP